MKRCLNRWNLTWFSFVSVIGAGIFVQTSQEAREHAGRAIVLSYVVSGISAMLSVFCYTGIHNRNPSRRQFLCQKRVQIQLSCPPCSAAKTHLPLAAILRSACGLFFMA
ncbi:hypothetical protein CDL15_Pgr000399 [Punica granatum]|uniref:Uncharacterized protein n=1 Tax=Punica granatum TaxID=22663 RepID=A0A218XUP4_PUNGR|nr:hypothetical protein CDL15_Pgr000399 [Punica granatum]